MSRRVVILTEIIAPYRIPVLNALARREGIDLRVIFLSETDPSLRQWQVYKEEICFSSEVLPSWRRRIGKYNLLLNRGVGSALRKAAPDALLCGGYSYLASWQAALWARRHRVPLLLWSESTAHDQRRGRAAVEFLKSWFLRLCDGFVVPGKSQREYLRMLGVPEPAIFTAPNAVDNDFYSRASAAARRDEAAVRAKLGLPPRYFLYVGRLVPEKGIFDLVEAYAKLDGNLRSAVGLVLVGGGVARPRLLEQAARIQPGVVQCCGFAQREQLAEYYALAETFVFPTHSDPWGLVVNEAMACGLPIIASNVAGCVADLVEEGWNGCLTPSCDPARLASAMDRLARDANLRAQMSSRSQERILSYSPEAWAAALAATLNSGRFRRHA